MPKPKAKPKPNRKYNPKPNQALDDARRCASEGHCSDEVVRVITVRVRVRVRVTVRVMYSSRKVTARTRRLTLLLHALGGPAVGERRHNLRTGGES